MIVCPGQKLPAVNSSGEARAVEIRHLDERSVVPPFASTAGPFATWIDSNWKRLLSAASVTLNAISAWKLEHSSEAVAFRMMPEMCRSCPRRRCRKGKMPGTALPLAACW